MNNKKVSYCYTIGDHPVYEKDSPIAALKQTEFLCPEQPQLEI